MHNQIKNNRLARGWSQSELAERAGTSNQMISMLERGKRGLTLQWMQRLAQAFDCPVADLLAKADDTSPFPELAQNLPVLGTVAGNVAGAFQLLDDEPIGFVKRPPGIAEGSHVYAVYVTGNSMSPEHRDGDLRFADPDAEARIGDTVIIQTQNHPQDSVQSYIKHLKARDEDWYLLGQLNPVGELKVAAKIVIAIAPILSLNKLFGA